MVMAGKVLESPWREVLVWYHPSDILRCQIKTPVRSGRKDHHEDKSWVGGSSMSGEGGG
jgi:hypothetical protein